jgi:prevent-host-death family protein
VTTVGLRELRQQASDLVRRAEAGENVTITVSGRPSVRLVPVEPRAWRRWEDLAELFSGRADPAWERDIRALDDEPRDPWASR